MVIVFCLVWRMRNPGGLSHCVLDSLQAHLTSWITEAVANYIVIFKCRQIPRSPFPETGLPIEIDV